MADLTYSIFYTPAAVLDDTEALNYACYDKKIHIRLKDFNEEELIFGFEKKLTYLLTYLINYSYLPKIIGNYDVDTILNNFLKSSDLLEIISEINLHSSEHVRGIILRKNYNHKKNYKPLGDVDQRCFPLKEIDGIAQCGSLKYFLSTLHITLHDYLFNDTYMVVIRTDKKIDINKKFINRKNKKINRVFSDNFGIAELW